MTLSTKTLCLQALGNMLGDDLARATNAFRGHTPEQMKRQWGQSGKTQQEILDTYQAWHDKVSAAINEVKAINPTA